MKRCALVLALVCLWALLTLPAFTHAEISKLIFINEPVSVAPSELSDKLWVQLQDSSGIHVDGAGQTLDVFFTSSSPTGEFFLFSSGNSLLSNGVYKSSITKTGYNKEFQYKDTKAGQHTITVNAQSRPDDSIQVDVSAMQRIVVGSGSETNENTNDTNNTSSAQTEVSTSGGSVDTSNSPRVQTTHTLSIGLERYASVNMPVVFESRLLQSGKEISSNDTMVWSFGDGGTATGATPMHQYYFPGDYVVVARTVLEGHAITARSNVHVLENDVAVSEFAPGTNGYIELQNNANHEVNLFGMRLVAGGYIYPVEQDLIISARSTLRLANLSTNIFTPQNSDVLLVRADGKIVQTYHHEIPLLPASQVAGASTQVGVSVIAPQISRAYSAQDAKSQETTLLSTLATSSSNATIVIGDSKPKAGFWLRVFSVPERIVLSVVNFFR